MRSVRTLKNRFAVWFVVIIAICVGIFIGAELALAKFGLLGEIDNISKAAPAALSSLMMLPIGFVIALIVVRFPMNPIKKLIHGMNRLASGHFEERLELGSAGSMKELADTFNALAAELQNTEILRSDFVNNFSHEFKTPIVSIRGFARMLNRQDLTPEEHQAYVDVIIEESNRLANMSTSVLNLTKLEKQSILTEVTEFNVSEQLRKCILLLEKKWTEKELVLDAEFDEQMIFAEQELLQQVWLNLLDNAIKFSPGGGELTVGVSKTEGRVRVSVSNQGPQITDEEKRRLFDKFWQGDPSRAAQGTGIGLSVVARIVALHRGEVLVDSTEERTTFTVVLPEKSAV